MDFITDLKAYIEDHIFMKMVLSNPRRKDHPYKKMEIRPVIIKNEYRIQFETIQNNMAKHENLTPEVAIDKIAGFVTNDYRNFFLRTKHTEFQGLVSKKGKVSVQSHAIDEKLMALSHDRKKDYILPEETKIDFLIKLGIMSEAGKVYQKKYNKFKQINKFVEIVHETVKDVPEDQKLKIVDFGCGKAYLTFAVYYYFTVIRHQEVEIIGLDLKEDVIDDCNQLAKALQYNQLRFLKGTIESFDAWDEVDMMMTLHACDIATDAALVKAIGWGAKYILSVPCCQHEFFSKIQNASLAPMLNHGLIKERLSSLVTDTARTLFLNKEGYDVQIIEFVSMAHTPKNMMITAKKTRKATKKEADLYERFKLFWSLDDLFIDRFYQTENPVPK